MSKAVEDEFKDKTDLECVLSRPGMFIGPIEEEETTCWYVEEGNVLTFGKTKTIPGLLQCFDEILVNAIDQSNREGTNVTRIEVSLDPETNIITVYNDGKGIPVAIHKKWEIYVPQGVFTNFKTSSNYNDEEKRLVGGQNGYGVKLAVAYSKAFEVRTFDSERKILYTQRFRDNMSVIEDPIIQKGYTGDFTGTRVRFKPDLARFKLEEKPNVLASHPIYKLIKRRAFDTAAISPAEVYLNSEKISIRNIGEYMKAFVGDEAPYIYLRVNPRWEVAIADLPDVCSKQNGYQLSFVNGINTSDGGKHVKHVMDDQICKQLAEIANKKNKNVKPFQVRNQLFVIINTRIENPTFHSQTKDKLTTNITKFGSKCVITPEMIKEIADSLYIIERVVATSEQKLIKDLTKGKGTKKKSNIHGIVKLEDAHEAGTRNSHLCTLIVTEGDSAKGFAMKGINIIGHKYYGVYPLRGKILNPQSGGDDPLKMLERALSTKKDAKTTADRKEINEIIAILGLKPGEVYDEKSIKKLRYGSIMIMSDQDFDGWHIKGLTMNVLNCLNPSLKLIPGFFKTFITPVIKAKKGKETMVFYTDHDYLEWEKSLTHTELAKWKMKYYKGLGTNNGIEAIEQFKKFDERVITYSVDKDVAVSEAALKLAFGPSKTYSNARKAWLTHVDESKYVDYARTKVVTINEFVNNELIHFSNYSNKRSTPDIRDGLKPGQRKILYYVLKHEIFTESKEVKVAGLAGAVSTETKYHHGEQSLCETIIKMAQNFTGSKNNLELLVPDGQFGTRLQLGDDSSQPRYIFTYASKWTKYIFDPRDNPLLVYNIEEQEKVEPEAFVPIIPMILINGAKGIGTGYSNYTPSYNPKEIISLLLEKLDGAKIGTKVSKLIPWYRGFKGTITKNYGKGKSQFKMKGIVELVDDEMIRVTEIPVTLSTEDFKARLEKMRYVDGDVTVKNCVIDYTVFNGDDDIMIEVNLAKGFKTLFGTKEKLLAAFGLTDGISTNNMNLFGSKGLETYKSIVDIFGEYYNIRLNLYEKRKDYYIKELERELLIIDAKVKFVLAVVEGRIELRNIPRADICVKISELKVPEYADKVTPQPYQYLLSMAMDSLTKEKVEKLREDYKSKNAELETLKSKTPVQLWKEDLLQLKDIIDKFW